MLKARIVTALLLVTGLGLVLFALPPVAAVWAFAAMAALAAWEWGGLMRQDPPARVMYALLLLVFCWQLQVVTPNLIPAVLGISAAFWILVVPLWFRFKWTLAGNDFFGYLIGFLVILPTWLAMVALHAISPWFLLAAMGLVWIADIAAYFSGRKFGQHKLAPAISPGKTWEGVAGAMVGVLVYGAIIASVAPDGVFDGVFDSVPRPWLLPGLVLLLVLLTAISIGGDLFESLLKRQVGIKDSSRLLPGHGGVLDRIDSLTSTLPVVALIAHLFRS